jgi:hypothetical protein
MYALGWWFSKSKNQFPPVTFPDKNFQTEKLGIFGFF